VQDSPLRGYIPVGAMITKLNDFALNLEYPDDDIWTRLMLEDSNILETTLGWCVEEKWFSGMILIVYERFLDLFLFV
jgi:S2P endopeptidase